MIQFDRKSIRTWSMLGPSGVLGLAACEFAETDKDFAIVTADLCSFSGLDRFKTNYPDRIYNVGIAEQNMIGVAAGMAKEGMNVFATTYATFASTRVLDQVKVNMGYMGLPVKLVGLTSGFSVGILGPTHMSMEDLAIMRSIPNMIVFSPSDCTETMKVLIAASNVEAPVYIRMSGTSRSPVIYSEDYDFTIGKAVRLKEGEDVCIMATGTMVNLSLKIAEEMEKEGVSCEVINFHTIKPIDEEMIINACNKKCIVTIEEHSRIGGFGSAVAEVLAPLRKKVPHLIIGTEDHYPHASSYVNLLRQNGLTEDIIYEKIKKFFKENE